MSTSLDRLKHKAGSLKSKRSTLVNKLFELEESLAVIFDGLDIQAYTKDVTLEVHSPDETTYGHLYFSDGAIKVAYRTSQEDYHDAMQGIPADEQGYGVRHISLVQAEWLEKLAAAENIVSLTADLEKRLDQLTNSTDASIAELTKLFESQTAQIQEDTLDVLKSFDKDLIKGWTLAHALISSEPAESITRSSSYIESVCKHILIGINKSLPQKQEMSPLINECVKALGLSEDALADTDLTQLVGSIKGICQSIGAIRSHFGIAHGAAPHTYKVNEHEARLLNTCAAAASVFLIKRYQAKQQGRND